MNEVELGPGDGCRYGYGESGRVQAGSSHGRIEWLTRQISGRGHPKPACDFSPWRCVAAGDVAASVLATSESVGASTGLVPWGRPLARSARCTRIDEERCMASCVRACVKTEEIPRKERQMEKEEE